MKIAFLIPSTTRGRKWRKMEDTGVDPYNSKPYDEFSNVFVFEIRNEIKN